MRSQSKNIFAPRFEPWFPGTESQFAQCATNQLCYAYKENTSHPMPTTLKKDFVILPIVNHRDTF